MAEHHIDTGDSPPIAVALYRLSPAKREILIAEVDKMLKLGLIEKCKLPLISNAVLVPKKVGEMRVSID